MDVLRCLCLVGPFGVRVKELLEVAAPEGLNEIVDQLAVAIALILAIVVLAQQLVLTRSKPLVLHLLLMQHLLISEFHFILILPGWGGSRHPSWEADGIGACLSRSSSERKDGGGANESESSESSEGVFGHGMCEVERRGERVEIRQVSCLVVGALERAQKRLVCRRED